MSGKDSILEMQFPHIFSFRSSDKPLCPHAWVREYEDAREEVPISCPCQLPVPTAALQGCLQTGLALGELLGIHTPSSARSQDWPLSFLPPLRVTPTGFYGFTSEMFHFQMRLCPSPFQTGLLPKPTRSLNFTVLEFPSPGAPGQFKSQFSSFMQSCPTLCDPMNCSTPGLPVHHQLPESTQTHVH